MSDILIIGSKNYNININNILDNFNKNIRINFSLPNGKNGTKIDILYVNNHVFENFFKYKHSKEKIKKIYNCSKEKLIIFEKLINIIKNNKHNGIKQQYETGTNNVSNKILKKNNININYNFVLRCGLQAILEYLGKNKNFIYGFSIVEEDSLSYDEKTFTSSMHSEKIEVCILQELHRNKLIDATLCLLDDKSEDFILNCKYLDPSEEIINLILKYSNKLILKDCKINIEDYNIDYADKEEKDNIIILFKNK